MNESDDSVQIDSWIDRLNSDIARVHEFDHRIVARVGVALPAFAAALFLFIRAISAEGPIHFDRVLRNAFVGLLIAWGLMSAYGLLTFSAGLEAHRRGIRTMQPHGLESVLDPYGPQAWRAVLRILLIAVATYFALSGFGGPRDVLSRGITWAIIVVEIGIVELVSGRLTTQASLIARTLVLPILRVVLPIALLVSFVEPAAMLSGTLVDYEASFAAAGCVLIAHFLIQQALQFDTLLSQQLIALRTVASTRTIPHTEIRNRYLGIYHGRLLPVSFVNQTTDLLAAATSEEE